jgi:hypothetical protein
MMPPQSDLPKAVANDNPLLRDDPACEPEKTLVMVNTDPEPRWEFAEGVSVRLEDGREWVLPSLESFGDAPEHDTLLAARVEAEDQAEGLRSELALTIGPHHRNHDLALDRLQHLLSFSPGDPRPQALQSTVPELLLASVRRRAAAEGAVAPCPKPTSLVASA